MKILDRPQSGKCGHIVAYQGPYGQCVRQHVVPANPQTAARQCRRRAFGGLSRAWGTRLTEEQRQRWVEAGAKVESAKRLESGPLTGQTHFVGINSARACIGQEVLWEPPEQAVLGLSPVGQLTVGNGEGGVRLLLRLTGPVGEDIMVFGQAPCSAGRMKRRNVAYLGLLPAAAGGVSDITEMYVARYGKPRAGEKVFVVTRQQKDGWEGQDQETSGIVPEEREGPQFAVHVPQSEASEVALEKAERQQRVGAGALSLQAYMYKGCTRDAQVNATPAAAGGLEGGERVSPKSEGRSAEEVGLAGQRQGRDAGATPGEAFLARRETGMVRDEDAGAALCRVLNSG